MMSYARGGGRINLSNLEALTINSNSDNLVGLEAINNPKMEKSYDS